MEDNTVVENKEITKCLNCGTEFQGNFCPECGQSANTGRFTVRFLFKNLFQAILSNDGGVWITLKSLFTKPGQMMVDIINGKRKSYFSPFPMLFLTLSLYVIIFTFTGSVKNKFDDISLANQPVDSPKVETPDVSDDSDKQSYTVELNLDDEDQKIEDTIKWCLNFYNNNYTTVFILTIPFYIFSARVCYGKKNRKRYNHGEYCIPIIYSLVLVVLYKCLTSIVFYFSQPVSEMMDNYSVFVTIAAFTVCFKKMMEFSVTKMLWRSLLLNAFYVMLMIVLVLLAVFVYAIILVS